MRLLKAVVAGFFVIVVGVFTAAVIAVSAVVLFIAQRLRRGDAAGRGNAQAGRGQVRRQARDVIDVTATEVPEAR